jgi:hypothetical protein
LPRLLVVVLVAGDPIDFAETSLGAGPATMTS